MMSVQNLKQAIWLQQAATQRVFSLIAEGGFEARVVGGAVRNTLLGVAISDIDFATTALPDDVVKLAQKAGIKYIPTGLSHGTVSLVIEDEMFEITTLRKDEQTDGRHAVVSFTDDWHVDAMRRDFTINALYADADGTLFDPLGGLSDITPLQIVFIGKADERIAEDYLRILRFFRFYAQYGTYGTGEINKVGFDACVRGGTGLKKVSEERIHVEMMKMLVAPLAQEAVFGLYQASLFPEISALVPRVSRFKIMVNIEEALEQRPSAVMRIGALFVVTEEDVALLDKHLRLSKAQKKQLGWFALLGFEDWLIAEKLDAFLYFNGGCAAKIGLFRFLLDKPLRDGWKEDYKAILSYIALWQKPKFPLSGQDLKERGFEGGVELGQALKALQHKWIESRFSLSKKALLKSL